MNATKPQPLFFEKLSIIILHVHMWSVIAHSIGALHGGAALSVRLTMPQTPCTWPMKRQPALDSAAARDDARETKGLVAAWQSWPARLGTYRTGHWPCRSTVSSTVLQDSCMCYLLALHLLTPTRKVATINGPFSRVEQSAVSRQQSAWP